jgi:hypothetical protein
VSLATLLTEPVSVLTASDGAADEFNSPSTTYSAGTEYLGRLEQRSAQEVTDGRDTMVSDWVLYLPPDATVVGRDRVVDMYGRTFEVVGPPIMQRSPRAAHHLQVNLRHVA